MNRFTTLATCILLTLFIHAVHATPPSAQKSTERVPFKEVDWSLSPGSAPPKLWRTPIIRHQPVLSSTDTAPEVNAEMAFRRYQHALMVYSTERYKLSSSRPQEQLEINQQLDDLSNQGIALIESEEMIPEELRSYFTGISQNGKDKMARLYFEEVGLSVRTFIDAENQRVYISFKGTDFSSFNSIWSAMSIASPSVQLAPEEKSYYSLILSQLIDTGELPYTHAGRYDAKTGFVCTLPLAFKRAEAVTAAFKKHYPGFSIQLIGYSQGGAIALHLALNTDDAEKTHVFNTQIPAPCLIRGASEERISRVVSTSIQDDMLNDASNSLLSIATWFFRHQQTEPFESHVLNVDPILEDKILHTYNKSPKQQLGYLQRGKNILSHGFIRHSPAAVLEAAKYYRYAGH
ncbi:MAG: hypothetical protein ACPG5T_06365 [Endozoicomonas sp.]